MAAVATVTTFLFRWPIPRDSRWGVDGTNIIADKYIKRVFLCVCYVASLNRCYYQPVVCSCFRINQELLVMFNLFSFKGFWGVYWQQNKWTMHLIFSLMGTILGVCKWHSRLCYARSCSRVFVSLIGTEYNGNCRNCLIFADSAEGYSRSKNLKSLNTELPSAFY